MTRTKTKMIYRVTIKDTDAAIFDRLPYVHDQRIATEADPRGRCLLDLTTSDPGALEAYLETCEAVLTYRVVG